MRLIVALAYLLFTSTIATAQNSDNYLDLSIDIPPNFTLNTATGIQTAQTISNCMHLTVASKSNHASISVAIPAGISTTSGTPMAVGTLKMKFNHTDCPAAQKRSVVTADVTMSTSPVFLFQQGKKNSLVAHWYYDLKLPILGYNYAPGTYNYTLQFTMTQP